MATGYALPAIQRASWLAAAAGLARAQCADTAAGRRRFVAHLDERAREEASRKAGVILPEGDRRRSHLHHGWYWGSAAFAEKMLQLAERAVTARRNRTYRSGAVARAHNEREAERLLHEGLVAAGLDQETLAGLPGSDERKRALGQLAPGANSRASELDCGTTGDAQRGQRQPAGAPLPEGKAAEITPKAGSVSSFSVKIC